MKKINKILLTLILILTNVTVYAVEEPLNGATLDTNNFILIEGNEESILNDNTLEDTKTYIKTTVDNELIYCADATEYIYVNEGNKKFNVCSYITGEKGKQLAYVLANGYTGKKIESGYTKTKYLTGNMKQDYYITQGAVWYYTVSQNWMKDSSIFNLKNGTINGKTTPVITNMINLINDAAKAGAGATLNINLSNTTMSLSSDKKYYISNPIKLVGTYLNSDIIANISGAEDAFVTTDQTSTTGKTNFEANSTVYVKVPVEKITENDTTITLKIESTTSINDKSVIECEYENYKTATDIQPITVYIPTSTKLNKSIDLTIKKYPITITKKDITNSKEVEGATLTIKNTSGDIINTWVSEKTPKTINLLPGDYILEETIAPDGYIKSTSKVEFTIDEKGKVLIDGKEVEELVITNKPIKVTISKRSITKSDELKGAKLKITDRDGKISTDTFGNKLEWTSGDKAKTFNLIPGEYILTETIAPKGYELSETTIEFTVNEEGKVLIDKKEVEDNLIIFKNTPEPEQVPTGNTMVYVAGILCLISLGVAIYLIIKRKEI